ncbi:MAG: hypothetical protein ACTSPI_13780 [Candidatus Heimdallarchaeaceae archaeon]
MEKKEAKEKLNISIEEEPDVIERVKDISFSLNTGQSGSVIYNSDYINGILEAILISSNNPVQIRIYFEGSEEIELFRIMKFVGNRYLPLRIGAMSDEGENYRDSPEKWVLNGRLVFEVKGGFNSNVNFIVRYC